MGSRPSAFTLIELLACIAVIALLTLLGFAGFSRALTDAKSASTIAGMRRIGVIFHDYAGDNDGRLPESSHQGPKTAWTTVVRRAAPAAILRSPLDPTTRSTSYAINDFLTPSPYGAEDQDFSRVQKIPAPSQTMLLGIVSKGQRNVDHFHFASEGWSAGAFEGDVWVDVANGSGIYLFVDGHVARIPWRDLKETLDTPSDRFVRPDGNPSQPK